MQNCLTPVSLFEDDTNDDDTNPTEYRNHNLLITSKYATDWAT